MGIGGLDCLSPPKIEESPKTIPFEVKHENEFNRIRKYWKIKFRKNKLV